MRRPRLLRVRPCNFAVELPELNIVSGQSGLTAPDRRIFRHGPRRWRVRRQTRQRRKSTPRDLGDGTAFIGEVLFRIGILQLRALTVDIDVAVVDERRLARRAFATNLLMLSIDRSKIVGAPMQFVLGVAFRQVRAHPL